MAIMETRQLNKKTFRFFYDRLLAIALSMFEWKGLPIEIDPIFMETALIEGSVLFLYDDIMGQYVVMRYMNGGRYDIYGKPYRRRGYANNGASYSVDYKNSVIIWNSVLLNSSIPAIDLCARRVANVQRVIDINIDAQRTPYALTGDKEQMTSLRIMYEQLGVNEPLIAKTKKITNGQLQVLETNAPYVADKLREELNAEWCDSLASLGIPVTMRNKKERLITGEVAGDNSAAASQLNTRLFPRQNAAERINKMFGLNIEVKYRVPPEELLMAPIYNGGNNGKVQPDNTGDSD